MRSLRSSRQRLPGVSGSASAGAFRAEEMRTIKRRERIGVLRILTWGLFIVVVAGFLAWSAHGRIVAEGMVETNLVEVRAPRRVLVKDVRIRPGQTFLRGEPLFVLESLETHEQRRALELDVDRARLRLALAESGGDLGVVDIDRRMSGADDSEREWRLAEAQLDVAEASLEVLRRSEQTLHAELARDVHGYDSQAAALEEKVDEVGALVGLAEADQRLAEYDVEMRRSLLEKGAVAERDLRTAQTQRDRSLHQQESYRAAGRALTSQAERLRTTGELERERVASELSELEARIDAASEEVEALRTRRDLWRNTTLRRRVLAADGPESVGRLRQLELSLLEKEVEAAEARLYAYDQRSGNGTVRAESDGVCDQLLVTIGTVVAEGELMATHYDPADKRIVAYVGPGASEELELGRACSVTPLRGTESVYGRIASSAAVWVPRPAAIPGREEPSADRRLAFQLALSGVPEHYRPGMRVTVVFERSSNPEEEAGLFDGFSRRLGKLLGRDDDEL